MSKMPIRTLEVILKVSERCNLDCSYCYFFYGGNEDYKKHPPLIGQDTIQSLTSFLDQAVRDMAIERIQIDFHGGEPLLLRKDRFDAMCTELSQRLAPIVKIDFAIQTNGVLVDDEWIDIFEKHQIGVGVSLDGPARLNDLARIDHQGRGSHARIVKAVHRLMQAANTRRLPKPAVLCVINPDHDVKEIFSHFVDELGFETANFLLPDITRNSIDYATKGIANYVRALYDEWTIRKNPRLRVRMIDQFVGGLIHGSPSSLGQHCAITVSSNGNVGPNDVFKIVDMDVFNRYNCATSTLRQFVEDPTISMLLDQSVRIPTECADCCWKLGCRGGDAYHRYDMRNGFDNPSAHCGAYKQAYSHIATHLIDSKSVPEEQILRSLQLA